MVKREQIRENERCNQCETYPKRGSEPDGLCIMCKSRDVVRYITEERRRERAQQWHSDLAVNSDLSAAEDELEYLVIEAQLLTSPVVANAVVRFVVNGLTGDPS